MNSRMILLLIAFTVLLAPSTMADVSSTFDTLKFNGTISYSSVFVNRILFDDFQFSVSDLASRADMIMNHFELAYRVPRIHSIKPDLICLLYRNIRAVYTRTVEEYQMFNNNSWILKDAGGTPITSTVYGYYIVDVGNPAYQAWLANWFKSYINQYGYDGAFLDNCLPSTEIMWSTTPTPAINPRTGKAWTALEFEQAVISIVNTIKNTIGNKLVVGNGVYYGEKFFGSSNQYYRDLLTQSQIDGIESEAWIMSLDPIGWYSESKWKASIDFAVWLENNFLNKSGTKSFLPVAQNIVPYERPGVALPNDTTSEQYVDYVFSSLLLAVSSNKTYLNFGYAVDNHTQSVFDINVGEPLGSYYMISGSHVYTRDYSKAKVLVNPTDTTYAVNLNGNYKNLDGSPATSPLTVSPHAGIVLERTASWHTA
jgi:hypothetical protein